MCPRVLRFRDTGARPLGATIDAAVYGRRGFRLIQVRSEALDDTRERNIVAEHAADMGAAIAAGPIRGRSMPFPCVSDCGRVGGHCLPTFRRGTNENLFADDRRRLPHCRRNRCRPCRGLRRMYRARCLRAGSCTVCGTRRAYYRAGVDRSSEWAGARRLSHGGAVAGIVVGAAKHRILQGVGRNRTARSSRPTDPPRG